MEVEISLEEAAKGIEKDLEIYKSVVCPNCHGQGGEPGSKIETCPACSGSGQITRTRRTGFFSFSSTETCPTCRGLGKKVSVSCSRCKGEGRIKDTQKISIRIPAGIESGQIIKLSGQGEAAELGGQAGDLYIWIKIKPHPQFKRKGNELFYYLVIHFTQAALGEKRYINFDWPIKLKIPAGIDSGEIIRLRGKGMSRFQGRGRGV